MLPLSRRGGVESPPQGNGGVCDIVCSYFCYIFGKRPAFCPACPACLENARSYRGFGWEYVVLDRRSLLASRDTTQTIQYPFYYVFSPRNPELSNGAQSRRARKLLPLNIYRRKSPRTKNGHGCGMFASLVSQYLPTL
jgi:hypothetical protein